MVLPRGQIREYHYASWFPDGQRVLITGVEQGQKFLRSYVQDFSGANPMPITEVPTVALLVSPNGKNLVVVDETGEYYISPYPNTEGVPATKIPEIGNATSEVPIQWSVDGRALYVRDTAPFNAKLYRIQISNGARTTLAEINPDPIGNIGLQLPDPKGIFITPDGQSYVYTYWNGSSKLFTVDGM